MSVQPPKTAGCWRRRAGAIDLVYGATGPTLRILLIDKAPRGPTARMVEASIDRRRKATGELSDVDLSIVSPDAVRVATTAPGMDGRLILVTASEPELSHRGSCDERRTPCQSLEVANALARHQRDRVCLIRSDAPPLSGVDIVATLVGGLAAVIDERLLLSDGVLDVLLDLSPATPRWRSVVVMGRSAPAVKALGAMLNAWDEGALRGDGTLDPACWRTAMALAQLNDLRPIAGTGDRFSFVKLAQGLNLMEKATSFRLSEHDLRKALAILASAWLDSSTHPSERLRLPTYARDHGFPLQPPTLHGVPDKDVPRRLYDVARAMELIERAGPDADAQQIVARVPTALVTNNL